MIFATGILTTCQRAICHRFPSCTNLYTEIYNLFPAEWDIKWVLIYILQLRTSKAVTVNNNHWLIFGLMLNLVCEGKDVNLHRLICGPCLFKHTHTHTLYTMKIQDFNKSMNNVHPTSYASFIRIRFPDQVINFT